MISNVVSQQQRGSFMSVNGSMQQLGQGMASLIAGAIVKTDRTTHQLSNYNWVGYLSIAILIIGVIIGKRIFKIVDTVPDDETPVDSKELVLDIVE